MAKHWKITERKKRRIVEYYVYKNSTIRETAKYFGISKSYVHYVIKEFQNNNAIAEGMLVSEIKTQKEKNVAERARRGGLATKAKNKRKEN